MIPFLIISFRLSTSLVISSTFNKIEVEVLSVFDKLNRVYEAKPTNTKKPTPNE